MHRQTIESYDAGAERWRRTRRADPATSTAAAAARTFREAVGAGLILDLGCGPGAALTALGDDVIGLDASVGMLALVDGADAPVVAGDVVALPFADNSTAGAFASFSFQHLPRDQFRAALIEVARVLRPYGLVELWMHAAEGTDGVRQEDDMGIPRWFTYWSRAELEVVVPSVGLDVVTIDDLGFARRTLARSRP